MGQMAEAEQLAAVNNEYLTFKLGDEEYGIDILKVQEIRGYDHVTRIANTPGWLKGVINLRGTIVPMRLKGMGCGPGSEKIRNSPGARVVSGM